MKKTLLYSFLITALVSTLIGAGVVLADDDSDDDKGKNREVPKLREFLKEKDDDRRASTTGTSTMRRIAKLDDASNRLRERADKEIDRRIESLNKLAEKIEDAKRISSSQKSSLNSTIQGQITLLNNLNIKINSDDTNTTTLKSDVQSITKAYRIYALVLPQIHIIAAAEKLASTTDLLAALSAKLQLRINAAETAGKNVANLKTLIADMNAKIADAKVQSAKAITLVTGLKSDNGNETVKTGNMTALKSARDSIKLGTKDVKDAIHAVVKIRVGLKNIGSLTNATSTSPVATSTATTTTTTTP
jgi:hypothetical protein